MPVEVGVGYISITPEARGFGRDLSRQIGGDLDQVGQQAGRDTGRGVLGGLGGTLKTGIAGVAAGAGALFAAGFAEAVEQDKSNARLGAQLGLTEKESARAGKVAGKVYSAGYGESIDQVNASLKALAQNGVAAISAPKKELAGLSKAALNLAETFDVDVTDAARAAGQMIRTGLADNGVQAFDLLTLGFQKGLDKGGDFIDTMNEYGTQFRKIGLTGAGAIGLISQALQAGARDSDVAADALKEFSIRAVDGSKTTAAGWKALGLNADDMAAKFAQGGAAANGVLDLTLDKLRGIKDPVKQSQIAVQLFGTQAEDLGASLLAMDPSTAAESLGKVGGAADKMGKSLHDTATQTIEVFKRQALQGLADFATKYALPALRDVGGFLNTYVLPAARTVGGAVAAVLVPAVSGMASAFMGAVGWVREYGAWLIPLGIAIGGVAVVAGASTIGTWAMTAAFTVYRGVILAATAVTRGWAVAQGILNAVMNANPIGLVVVGIMALVAAAVVAYNKVGWFRDLVNAAWAGIKAGWDALWTNALKPGFEALSAAAMWLWNNAIGPAFRGISALFGWWWSGVKMYFGAVVTAFQAIGSAASWLWTTILSPVFSAIWTAGKVLFTILAVVVITPLVLAFKVLGAIAMWLWDVAIGPAFRGIVALAQWWWSAVKMYFGFVGALATWLWDNAIKPAFDGIMAGIRAVGAVATWLWQNVFSPVLGWIASKAIWLWEQKIKPTWELLKAGIGLVGDKIKQLWNDYASPVFAWIADKGKWLWDKGLKPAFDAIKKGASLVGDAFESAKEAIGKAWSKIKDLAKGPVNFVLEFVYTKGIKAVWDKVAKFVGLDPLPKAPKLLAEGGRTSGGVPGKDSIPALLMADEYVVKRNSARKVGFGTLEYINRTGQLPPVQRFAEGGVVEGITGWLGDKAKAIGGAIMDSAEFLANPKKAWESVTSWVRDKIAEIGSSSMARTIAGIPKKMLGSLKDKILKAAEDFLGGGGNGSWLKPVMGGLGTRYGVAGRMWSSGYHTGTDFPAPTGAAVKAVAGGVVQSALSGGPYGNHITIKHGGSLQSLYAHLSSMAVAAGQSVRRGQRIGAVGATGNTTGPHLHLEARRGGRTINPEPLLGYSRGGSPRPGEVAWVGENGAELVRFGPGGGTVLDHDSSLAAVGAAVVQGMTRALPSAMPAGGRAPAVVPVTAPAGAGATAGDTYVVNARTADITVQDLELLQRQRDARARVRRPR